MKKTLSILAMCIFFACQTQLPEAYQVISPSEMMGLQSEVEDFILIDLRTPGEVEKGYIAGTEFMDFRSPDFKARLESLDRKKTYGLYCGSGGRSNDAMLMMKEMGFERVYDMEGGYKSYIQQMK